ncbi:hypothetical protein EVAR_882_1 [Eumeta japonica]|uniref:Uncharacterized protein n=1 Tax=Eumeta variegata TaxID=151549 RepID=A0A4C1SDP1_EUMVA|nr:hypothetical protein EVAR_882_1 [Eumeta japonica]
MAVGGRMAPALARPLPFRATFDLWLDIKKRKRRDAPHRLAVGRSISRPLLKSSFPKMTCHGRCAASIPYAGTKYSPLVGGVRNTPNILAFRENPCAHAALGTYMVYVTSMCRAVYNHERSLLLQFANFEDVRRNGVLSHISE